MSRAPLTAFTFRGGAAVLLVAAGVVFTASCAASALGGRGWWPLTFALTAGAVTCSVAAHLLGSPAPGDGTPAAPAPAGDPHLAQAGSSGNDGHP